MKRLLLILIAITLCLTLAACGDRTGGGEHTLTLTVTDLTGNTTTKVLRFHVTETGEDGGVIIDQGV